uniref:Low-density lipoprotein receptor-related protein 11 n=1 Tax=Phallusia mammillata TaxID=59560 RepID=A0A6F9DJX3_9ASCI|nr:low-density lipoprotein receptor-related protein 11 [Phallusia mammillata]
MVGKLGLHVCLVCYILLPWLVFLCETKANNESTDNRVPILDNLSKSQLSKLVDELLSKADGAQPQSELQECQNNFQTHNDQIIRTRDSLQNGAQFLVAVPHIASAQACFQKCCKFENENENENQRCDLSVFQATSARQNVPQCFLFDCVNESKDNEFLCLFSKHTGYVTYKRQVSLSNSDGPLQTSTTHGTQTSHPISAVISNKDHDGDILPIQRCDKFEWKCGTGVCINMFSVCNKVIDCSDGSDEIDCPGTTWQHFSNDDEKHIIDVNNVTTTAFPTMEPTQTILKLTSLQKSTLHSTTTTIITSSTEKEFEDQVVSAVHPEQGALLPLALGLAVTVCVLVMVLCRLKIMKKKFSRKPGPLLMDESDYLINGMYL